MAVADFMTLVVPATKGQINSPHKCQGLVNNDDLLVMSPQQNTRREEIRMTEKLKRMRDKERESTYHSKEMEETNEYTCTIDIHSCVYVINI